MAWVGGLSLLKVDTLTTIINQDKVKTNRVVRIAVLPDPEKVSRKEDMGIPFKIGFFSFRIFGIQGKAVFQNIEGT